MKKKKVKCAECKRDMDVPEEENPPYFCYKCDDYMEKRAQYVDRDYPATRAEWEKSRRR